MPAFPILIFQRPLRKQIVRKQNSMNVELSNLVQLSDSVAVICLIAYLLTRTKYALFLVNNKQTLYSTLFMAIIGGFVYLYGALTSVEIGPYHLSIQVIGPAIAGLIAGSASGFFAGLFGILLIIPAGYPINPAMAIIALLSGILGGVFKLWNKKPQMPVSYAFLLGCLMAGIQFIAAGDVSEILDPEEIVEGIIDLLVPTILCLCLFVFIINNLKTEAENNKKSFHLEGELLAAKKIQMESLPCQTQEWEHLSLAASLIPASYVGGDLYDYLELDDGSVYFALGDVSGKGVPAALLMSSTRMVLRSKVRNSREPCDLISEVNRSFLEDGDKQQFITLIVGIIQPDTGEVRYCNAGHPAPFLISNTGVRQLDSEGNLPAGVMEDEIFSPHHITMNPGEILVLISDGVTEAEFQGIFFEEKRVIEVLSRNPQPDPEAVVALLNQEVKTWTGDHPMSDDCTILAIGYYPDRI